MSVRLRTMPAAPDRPPLPAGLRLLLAGLALIPATVVVASDRPAIGDAVSLPDLAAIDGTRLDAAALTGHPALVLAWTDLECPMAKLYLPRLAALETENAERGVRFLVVDSTAEDEPGALAARARELGLRAPVVRDAGGALARRLGVRRTTEVLVLDRHARLAYRGAIDDQYGYRRNAGQGAATFRRDQPSRHYLRDALAAVLAGKAAEPRETDPLGCELTLENGPADAASGNALAPVPTFHETIQPILQRSCQECHRRDAGAPFPLETYDDARRRARMLREVVRERRMPPWNADRRVGKFRNDPSLGDEEIAAIARWAEGGAPEGDPKKSPPARRFAAGWDIGEPDAVFEAPPFEVPASGQVPYRYVRIRNEAAEDRWVEAAQVRSTGRGLVHHVLVFLEKVPPAPAGAERPWKPAFNPLALLEGAKPEDVPQWIRRFREHIRKDLRVGQAGGLNGYFVSSNAGQQPTPFPPGCARLLPAGATLVLQIHYTPTGEAFTSTTRLGLRFARGPSPRALDCRGIATVAFAIPPGEANHEVQATYVLPRAATIYSLRPHMHRRGKSFRYIAEHPGGSSEVLLGVPAWDFDWQVDYQLAVPLRLEAGTRLRAIAAYDNSRENPYNPDPEKTVYFGLQSDEEMMIGYFEAVWDVEEPKS